MILEKEKLMFEKENIIQIVLDLKRLVTRSKMLQIEKYGHC